MRYLLVAMVLAASIVAGLMLWTSAQSVWPAPEIIGLSVPSSVFVGENVTVFGGLTVPEGRFEIGTFSCQAGTCRRSLWRQVEGPAQLWTSFGGIRFEEAGVPAAVHIRVFEVGRVTERVLGTFVQSVEVLAVGESANAAVNVVADDLALVHVTVP